MFAVTGDTHGEEARFQYMDSAVEKNLKEGDYLFICGDFGYISNDGYQEHLFLRFLAEKPYTICFVDGNHENFDVLEAFPVEEWCGGKAHIIRRTREGVPKVIHLMRGQVFEIEGKRIFTFGGGYSIDKAWRVPYRSWWPREMPSDEEYKEAIANLAACGNRVDYILTHAAPEDTMTLFHPEHEHEKPLNNFLEWVRENVDYKHWYMGHLHRDEDVYRNQTILHFSVRDMETNEEIEEKVGEG